MAGIITPELDALAAALLSKIDNGGEVFKPVRLPPVIAEREPSALPSADDGSRANESTAESFFAAAFPGIWALESDTGTGKSRAAVIAASAHPIEDPDARLLAVFKSHLMAADTVEKFRKEAEATGREIKVAVYRGEDQEDPRFADLSADELAEGRRADLTLNLMCRRASARKAARTAGSASLACEGCPFNPSDAPADLACGYKLQSTKAGKETFAEARVVIMAGQSFFGNKLPGAIKRAADWRPVERINGRPVLDGMGQPVPDLEQPSRRERAEAEKGEALGVCKYDFSHAWVDEISPMSVAVKNLPRRSTWTLTGFRDVVTEAQLIDDKAADRIIKAHLDARSFHKVDAVSEEDRGSFGIGDVITFCEGHLERLRQMLEYMALRARSETPTIPGGVSAHMLEKLALTSPVLAVIKATIWKTQCAPREDLGGLSASEIEISSAANAEHFQKVKALAGIVDCTLAALGVVARAKRDAEREFAEAAFAEQQHQTYEFGHCSIATAEAIVEERVSAGELPACRPRIHEADNLPGIEVLAADAESESSGATVYLAKRNALGHLARSLPILITAAKCDREEMALAFPGLLINYSGPPVVRDGEGVFRSQRHDSVMSKTACVPNPQSDRFSTQVVNAMRITMDAVCAFGLAGGAFVLDDAQRPEASTPEGQQARAGLITYKDALTYVRRALPGLHRGAITMHYGNVTGSNAMENVRSLTVAGRVSASVRDLERSASVLAMRAVKRVEPDSHGRVMLDSVIDWKPDPNAPNGVIGISREQHPDPDCERQRSSTSGGDLMQAEARGRAVRRTADNPLAVNLVTSTPCERVIDTYYGRWQWEARTGFVALPLALGVWPAKPRDGKNNYRGWMFQILGRAGFAFLGNIAGELPEVEENPGLLVAHAPSATPRHCGKMLDDRMGKSSDLATFMQDVEDVMQNGEEGVRYLAGGSAPMTGGGWHLVQIDANGSQVSMWARGADEQEAQQRAEALLQMGLDAMRSKIAEQDAESGQEIQADAKTAQDAEAIRRAALPPEQVAAEDAVRKLQDAWSKHDALGLTDHYMLKFAPGIWGSRRDADRDLGAVHEYFAGMPIKGAKTGRALSRAFLNCAQDVSATCYKSSYKESRTDFAQKFGEVQKTPAQNSPFEGENDGLAAQDYYFDSISSDATLLRGEIGLAASLLAVTAGDGGSEPAALVEYTPDRKGAQAVTLLMKIPRHLAPVVEEAALHFDQGAIAGLERALKADTEEARQRVERMAARLQEAVAALDAKGEEVEAAKLAQKAGEITKAAMAAVRAEKKPLREHRDDVKKLLASARSRLKKAQQAEAEGYRAPPAVAMIASNLALALKEIEPQGAKGFKVVHVFAAGTEIDWHAFHAEAVADQPRVESQPDALGVPEVPQDAGQGADHGEEHPEPVEYSQTPEEEAAEAERLAELSWQREEAERAFMREHIASLSAWQEIEEQRRIDHDRREQERWEAMHPEEAA